MGQCRVEPAHCDQAPAKRMLNNYKNFIVLQWVAAIYCKPAYIGLHLLLGPCVGMITWAQALRTNVKAGHACSRAGHGDSCLLSSLGPLRL